MEDYIPISYLNDFVFCPRSIYFHQLFGRRSTYLYQDVPQTLGKAAHLAIDTQKYSSKKDILQGIDVYCEKYQLSGKIDIFDISKKLLTERKKLIKTIYDGYYFQIYAQYYCLLEMGYQVERLQFYSMDTNKIYPVKLPDSNLQMKAKFEDIITQIHIFDLDKAPAPNPQKCRNCIYEPLCDVSLC